MGKLTREAVVERALQIGDAEGLAAVTIRRLAQELGVTPMALYWHFKNKEQLTVGMADHLIEGFVIEEDGAPGRSSSARWSRASSGCCAAIPARRPSSKRSTAWRCRTSCACGTPRSDWPSGRASVTSRAA
nr:hypothetical protein GCM10020093_067600 [Planobispora longispora]